MRVLLTTDTIGGVWTFTKELCEGLLALGHDVALVSLGRLPSPAQAAWCASVEARYGKRFRYAALDAPLEWMECNQDAYDGAEAVLLHLVDEFEPEVVHSGQFCFGALPVGVPKVVTAHSDVVSWAEACVPEGLEPSTWLSRYRLLVSAGLRGGSAVVAPTRWMAEAVRRGFPVVDEVRVIANGRTLTCPAFQEERMLQAVSVGRCWDKAKQIAMLDGLDSEMLFVLAGETKLGEDDALSEEQVLALFRRSSVYVATSIYEPFGLAPLEAALCGCAVVANDIPSLREVWGDAAIYFSGQESLREVLRGLSRSPDALRAAQVRSERRGAQLSAEKMVEGYVKLYTELLGGRVKAERVEVEASAG